jgi:hypothetical protein
MSGRSTSAVALALLFAFAPARAFAKTVTFYTGVPFGLGVVAGIANRPTTDFVTGNKTSASNYSDYFGVEPFFDAGNVVIRGTAAWHLYPLASGAGSDTHGNFTDSSEASSFDYGLRVELAPYVSQDARSRFYLVVGVFDTLVKLTNNRKYTSGGNAGTTYSAQLQGSSVGVNGGIGFEFFLIQNWSIALEAGYTGAAVGTFHYRTSTDEANNTVSSASVAQDSAGNNKGFKSYSPYGQVVLNLNL